ncbi:AraC family transcriptional regulator, partial [Pseudomonadota bacterium]
MRSINLEVGDMGQARQRQRTQPQMLRIGATLGLPDVLRSLGADPGNVMNEVGVDHELFGDPNNLISFALRGRLLAHCAERMSCQHLGLLVGQQASLHSLGMLGLRAKYSTDVGSALEILKRYLHLHVRGATTTLAIDSGLAVLEYQIYQTRALGNDQVGDGAVAVLYNILSELCGNDWRPIEVRFAHRRPIDDEPFQQFFRAPLRFDSNEYSVVFSAAWLGHRLPDVDSEVRRLLQQEVNKIEIHQEDDFTDQVLSVLRTAIVTGHSSADEVAELFSMHRCTLSRHLKELGTSFQNLLDEVRFEIARQLLEDSRMEIIQIAALLGYSNASAFTRAFRRRSSTT